MKLTFAFVKINTIHTNSAQRPKESLFIFVQLNCELLIWISARIGFPIKFRVVYLISSQLSKTTFLGDDQCARAIQTLWYGSKCVLPLWDTSIDVTLPLENDQANCIIKVTTMHLAASSTTEVDHKPCKICEAHWHSCYWQCFATI